MFWGLREKGGLVTNAETPQLGSWISYNPDDLAGVSHSERIPVGADTRGKSNDLHNAKYSNII